MRVTLAEDEKRELKWNPQSSSYGGLNFIIDQGRQTSLFLGTITLAQDRKLQDFLKRSSKPEFDRFLYLYGLHCPACDDCVVRDLTVGKYVPAKAIAELS